MLTSAARVDNHPCFAFKFGGPLCRRFIALGISRSSEYSGDGLILFLCVEQSLKSVGEQLATGFADVRIADALRCRSTTTATDFDRILLTPNVERSFVFTRPRKAPGRSHVANVENGLAGFA